MAYQADRNKQGSGEYLDHVVGAELSQDEEQLQALARQVYEKRLQVGVAREQARKDLTLSTYTEAYWKIDLHNLFHFLWLRMAQNAQHEIRSYANVIGKEIVSKWCPLAWEAFVDYRLNSIILSRIDIELIKAFNSGGVTSALQVARENGLIPKPGADFQKNRERNELEEKLEFLGIPIPWHSK